MNTTTIKVNSKEELSKMIKTHARLLGSYNAKEIDILSKVFWNQYNNILKELEILEAIKKSGLLDIVFSENTFVNIVITDADCINVDYDRGVPDIEMKIEDYDKIISYIKSK